MDISPGETTILVFVTRELPDISYWQAIGRDSISIPEYIAPSEDQAEDLNYQYGEPLYHALTPFGPGKYGRTVGPGPLPPQSLDSMVIHLQVRNDTALAIGWMDEHAHNRLGRILEQALRWAQEERLDRYRATLERFLNTLERLHNQGHVRDEAFYVLYYRARYILNRLPFPEGPPGRME